MYNPAVDIGGLLQAMSTLCPSPRNVCIIFGTVQLGVYLGDTINRLL